MRKLINASFRKDRKKGNQKISPTRMLMQGSEQVYVQNGAIFRANGKAFAPNEIPDWVVAQLKADKDSLEDVGFSLKFGKLTSLVKPEEDKGPARSRAPASKDTEDDPDEDEDEDDEDEDEKDDK